MTPTSPIVVNILYIFYFALAGLSTADGEYRKAFYWLFSLRITYTVMR